MLFQFPKYVIRRTNPQNLIKMNVSLFSRNWKMMQTCAHIHHRCQCVLFTPVFRLYESPSADYVRNSSVYAHGFFVELYVQVYLDYLRSSIKIIQINPAIYVWKGSMDLFKMFYYMKCAIL